MLSIWTSLKFCCLEKSQLFTMQSRLLMTLKKKSFENIVEKGENRFKEWIDFFLFHGGMKKKKKSMISFFFIPPWNKKKKNSLHSL